MSLRMTESPTVPGGRATSCGRSPLFTYNIGYIDNVRRNFLVGGGGAYIGRSSHIEIIHRNSIHYLENDQELNRKNKFSFN